MANKEQPTEGEQKELSINASLDEALIGLPKEKQEQIRSIIAIKQEVAYSGPIPPPEHFAQYESVLPGASERILAMAEREQEHRHHNDREFNKLSFIGLWIGSILTLILIGVSAYAIYSGATSIGGAIITAIVLISVIYVLRKAPSSK